MRLTAHIALSTAFHESHDWTVSIQGDTGTVLGYCPGCSSNAAKAIEENMAAFDCMTIWNVSAKDIANAPENVQQGLYPALMPETDRTIYLDGGTVKLSIVTDKTERFVSIRCRDDERCWEYLALVRWCWTGLNQHAKRPHRLNLEALCPYFADGWLTTGSKRIPRSPG